MKRTCLCLVLAATLVLSPGCMALAPVAGPIIYATARLIGAFSRHTPEPVMGPPAPSEQETE